MIAKRWMNEKALASCTVAASAYTGAPKASPTRAEIGSTSSAHHESAAPNSAVTPRNTAHEVSSRNSTKIMSPPTIAGIDSGAAYIEWYVRIHWNLAITGNVASPTATCIAVEAIMPGAM